MSTPLEFEKFKASYLAHYMSALEKMAQKDSVAALRDFYIDKHNFKYFFDQLSTVVTDSTVSKEIIATYMKFANTISSYTNISHILNNILELQDHIEAFLSSLKKIGPLIKKDFEIPNDTFASFVLCESSSTMSGSYCFHHFTVWASIFLVILGQLCMCTTR